MYVCVPVTPTAINDQFIAVLTMTDLIKKTQSHHDLVILLSTFILSVGLIERRVYISLHPECELLCSNDFRGKQGVANVLKN